MKVTHVHISALQESLEHMNDNPSVIVDVAEAEVDLRGLFEQPHSGHSNPISFKAPKNLYHSMLHKMIREVRLVHR
jgi:hypothetical protein